MAEVHRKAIRLGLICSINNFHKMVRNIVYCGKIRISSNKEEEACVVKGLHEALIPVSVFNKVQYVLSKNIKKPKSAIATPNDLVLRGYLKCPFCHRMLTGSASKGKTKHTVYYHCKSLCKARFNALRLNDYFSEELKIVCGTKQQQLKLIKNIQMKFESAKQDISIKQQQYKEELDNLDNKLFKARDMVLIGEIEPSDFAAVRIEYETRVRDINTELISFSNYSENRFDIKETIKNVVDNIISIPESYKKANLAAKRCLIEILFNGLLVYDGISFSSSKLNNILSRNYFNEEQHSISDFMFNLNRLANIKNKMFEYDPFLRELNR